MRDGITLAGLGKPVAVIVQETFDRAARVHARGSGCPELAIVAYPHPAPGADAGAQTMQRLAAELFEKITRAL